MTLFWIFVVLVVLWMLFDRFVEKMYAYEIVPHKKTPADFGLAFEEIRIPTVKGKSLYGWWIPADSSDAPALILIHGWSRNVERMLPYIRHLHPAGYNLLAFDARNHGSSDMEPHPNVMSFAEDACAAIDFVEKEKPDAARAGIGIVGLSIGGGAAIDAAAMKPEIRAAVTVGAISHPIAVMSYQFEQRGVPSFIANLFFKYLQLRYRMNFDEIAPLAHISKANASFLLIHGEKDETIPLAQGKALAAAGDPSKTELWVVPKKGHSDCHTHPEFWEKVLSFLDATLPVK
jgi:pimeloyl-ACP methyl ester carboxylesterase